MRKLTYVKTLEMTITNTILCLDKTDDPRHHRWGVPCSKCLFSLGAFEITAETFFREGSIPCKHCGEQVNLWHASERFASNSFPGAMTVSALGATQTRLEFELKPGESKEIDFGTVGIPDSATILGLTFSPQGKSWPLLRHSNNALIRFIGSKVWVYGVPFDLGQEGRPVFGSVTWIERGQNTQSFLYMVDAMEAMSARKFLHVILSAHIAFELEAISLVRAALERFASRSKVRDFIERELTLANAINVILPNICGREHIPVLSDDLRGALNQLRELRNRIVHEGLADTDISENVACRMLFAAMFGFEYTRFVRKQLFPQNAPPGKPSDGTNANTITT